jgi:PEP-CTERM motif
MKLLSVLLAAAALCGMASSASATIATITYTGTVATGADETGIFGQAATELGGDAFKLVYTLDTSKGNSAGGCSGGQCFQEDYGGSNFGVAPSMTAALTIKGVTVFFDGSLVSDDFSRQNSNGSGLSQISQEDFGGIGLVRSNFINGNGSNFFPLSLTTPYSLSLIGSAEQATDFSISGASGTARGTFSPDHVSLSVPGVPEPASWAMMLVGFGLAGVALRRGRTVVAA